MSPPPESSRSRQLKVLGEEPFNAEPDLVKLLQHQLTPVELVYCRNHCDVQKLDDATFTVTIDGLVERDQKLSLDDLKTNFPSKSVVAALQCAGNRRQKMVEKTHKDVEGLKWGEATICNVKWTGVLLRDLLIHAGVRLDNSNGLHVCVASHVAECQDDDYYGVSVPLEKALDIHGDVLLAYHMNDSPLTPDHGHPLRVVVPGYSGVRWVKWVDRITVTSRESQNFYQQKDYKVLPVTVETREKADSEDWWSRIPALQANPLNSAIAGIKVEQNDKKYVPDDSQTEVLINGYALSGPGPTGQVKSIEVSTDYGRIWLPANITYQEGRWSWTLWEARIRIGAETESGQETKKVVVWSRATDENGVQQMPDCDWNLRGVAYNAIGERIIEF